MVNTQILIIAFTCLAGICFVPVWTSQLIDLIMTYE
jgi:hypothetical protein